MLGLMFTVQHLINMLGKKKGGEEQGGRERKGGEKGRGAGRPLVTLRIGVDLTCVSP